MMEDIEILNPFMMQVSEDEVPPKDPYALNGSSMNDLHGRSHQKLRALFPEAPPYELVKRINAEVEVLWEGPYAYALMAADDAAKHLRKEGISVALTGRWRESYYAYLIGLLEEAPSEEMLKRTFSAGAVELQVETGKKQCLVEALFLSVRKYGFYLRLFEDHWEILPPEQDCDLRAPIITISEVH